MVKETLANARASKPGVLRLILASGCNLTNNIFDVEIRNDGDYSQLVQKNLNTYHSQILNSGLQTLIGNLNDFIRDHHDKRAPTIIYDGTGLRIVNVEKLEQKELERLNVIKTERKEKRRQERINNYISDFSKAQEIYSSNQLLPALKLLNDFAKATNGRLKVHGGELVREYDNELSEMEVKERAERLNTSEYFKDRTMDLKEKIYSVLKVTKKKTDMKEQFILEKGYNDLPEELTISEALEKIFPTEYLLFKRLINQDSNLGTAMTHEKRIENIEETKKTCRIDIQQLVILLNNIDEFKQLVVAEYPDIKNDLAQLYIDADGSLGYFI